VKTPVIETGTVLRTDGDTALVITDRGSSCRGCGMGKLGLCRPGGSGMLLKVSNTLGAAGGDRVVVGLEQKIHFRGYFIAYLLPLLILVASTLSGYMASKLLGIGGLDIVAGLGGLTLTVIYSLKKMKNMDRQQRLHIKRIINDTGDFCWEENLGAEGRDYMARFSGR